MAKVSWVQGEAKTLPFLIRNKVTGKPEDLTAARFLLSLKRSMDDCYYTMQKQPADFDTSAAATGYVSVFLTADDTYLEPFIYLAELRVTLNGDPAPIEKLAFEFEIIQGIGPTDLNLASTGIVSLEAVGAPTIQQL